MGHDKRPSYVPAEAPEILEMEVSENQEWGQAEPEVFLYHEHHEDDEIDEVKKDQAEKMKDDFTMITP